MIQPILAEFCGRWGCTWWEGILTVIFVSILKSPTGFVILLVLGTALLLVSAALPLLLIQVLASGIGAIANWIRGKQNASNTNKCQQRDKHTLSARGFLLAHAAKVLVSSDDNTGKSQQQDECILSARGKLLSRAAKLLGHKK